MDPLLLGMWRNALFGLNVLVFILSSTVGLAVAADAPSSPTTVQKDKEKASDPGEIQERAVRKPVAKPTQPDVMLTQPQTPATPPGVPIPYPVVPEKKQ